jgi:hypothetical protein
MVDGKLINAWADLDARSYLSGTQNGCTLSIFDVYMQVVGKLFIHLLYK